MIDRFGLLPEATKNLFRVTSFKLIAEHLGIVKLDAGSQSGRLEFDSTPKVDPFTLVMMVQKQPQKYKLEGASHLRFILDMDDSEKRFNAVDNLLQELGKVSQ
jgi:transcription-repair coupling factor (superfamily II helicase)